MTHYDVRGGMVQYAWRAFCHKSARVTMRKPGDTLN